MTGLAAGASIAPLAGSGRAGIGARGAGVAPGPAADAAARSARGGSGGAAADPVAPARGRTHDRHAAASRGDTARCGRRLRRGRHAAASRVDAARCGRRLRRGRTHDRHAAAIRVDAARCGRRLRRGRTRDRHAAASRAVRLIAVGALAPVVSPALRRHFDRAPCIAVGGSPPSFHRHCVVASTAPRASPSGRSPPSFTGIASSLRPHPVRGTARALPVPDCRPAPRAGRKPPASTRGTRRPRPLACA